MSYNFSEVTFPSADGKTTVYGEIYTPKNRSSVGIVQISHGMIDHIGRYKNLINYLTENGYVVAGNHHLGHGRSIVSESEYGFFAEKGGVDILLSDLHEMNRILRYQFPTLPLILLGHSMGSFLARLYAVEYSHTVKGVIIHGTSGPNPAAGAGALLASLISATKGTHHRSKLLHSLSIGAYLKKFPSEGSLGWLTREVSQVADRETDPYTQFAFSASAFGDLFTMLRAANKKDWYKKYPKNIPALVMSGDADPVGDFGRGVRTVYKNLLMAGAEVSLKLYEGARHELFNETNREEVFADILEWLGTVVEKSRFTF